MFWACTAHLGGLLTYLYLGWLPPLLVYIGAKGRTERVLQHARSALNFQITLLVLLVAGWVLDNLPGTGPLGWFVRPAVGLTSIVVALVAVRAVLEQRDFRYRFSWPFFD